MFTKKNNRRQFLKLASGLIAAPLGSMPFYANSQTVTQKPLRFLTIIDHFGVPVANRNETWISSPTGDYALSNENLGTILQPLAAYRENMLVISGIDLDSSILGGGANSHHEFNPHPLGGSCTLNGTGPRTPSARLSHETLDVFIGNYLSSNSIVNNRVYPHLFFTDKQRRIRPTYCFDTSGVMIRSLAGATSGVNTLFGSSVNQEVDPLLRAEFLAKKDLLDKVGARVQILKNQFDNASYHEKLDAYDTSVSDLATQLELQQNLSCEIPDAFNTFTDVVLEESRGDVLKVIGQLFTCNMATSVTYAFGDEFMNGLAHAFLEHPEDEVQDLLNRGLHASSHSTADNANKVHELVRIHQAEMIAELMNTLSTTIDIDGSPMIDNTVVYLPSCMANNTHQRTNYALMVMAGKNTNLQGGFHYDCGENTNNDVLTTLAQGLNVPITSWGGYAKSGALLPELNNGPISKMLKTVHSG